MDEKDGLRRASRTKFCQRRNTMDFIPGKMNPLDNRFCGYLWFESAF